MHPALPRHALVGVLLAGALTTSLALTGCAGKAPAAAGSSGTAAASTPAATTITVTVAHGKASGDTGRIPVPTGTPVRLVVTSDTADEVHLHGYDIEKDLVPGTPTTLTFVADVPGVFEVELHKANVVILHIQVG